MFWKADRVKYNYSKYLQTKTFKHLIEMMLKHDPAERLSMEELVVHDWMTGAFASDIQFKAELLRRRAVWNA